MDWQLFSTPLCDTLDHVSTDSSPGGGRRMVREGKMDEREVGEGKEEG